MGYEIDVKVSSVAYLVGVPVLFVGVVAVSTTVVSVGAAILTGMAGHGQVWPKDGQGKEGESEMKKVANERTRAIQLLGSHLADIADEYGEVMCDLTVQVPEGFYPLAEELYGYLVQQGWTPPS